MIGWLLSFALVVIFLLFMKDFIQLLFSSTSRFTPKEVRLFQRFAHFAGPCEWAKAL